MVATLRYNAGAADKMEGATIPLGPAYLDFTLMEPLGVTAHILPWNYPLGMAARSLAPALAAGCTAVVKPAEQSPLTALRLAAIAAETGFPAGVINVVTGYGEDAGDALVRHPLVRGDHLHRLGRDRPPGHGRGRRRPEAGRARARRQEPAPRLPRRRPRPPGRGLADGAFGNTGQVCSACSRLLVAPSIADELVERVRARAERVTVGPGREDPDIGPLVSAEQHERVTGYLAEARRDGARLVTGGGRPPGLERGYFVAPTVFDRVDPSSRIAREEVFGPVLTVTPFRDEEEALRLANGLGYGLCAGVYTRDISRALTLARRLEAGTVWINGWFIGGQQAPTGGTKDSGIGRERGLPGVRNYLQIKNVGIRL